MHLRDETAQCVTNKYYWVVRSKMTRLEGHLARIGGRRIVIAKSRPERPLRDLVMDGKMGLFLQWIFRKYSFSLWAVFI
jgi:hypothetical protein